MAVIFWNMSVSQTRQILIIFKYRSSAGSTSSFQLEKIKCVRRLSNWLLSTVSQSSSFSFWKSSQSCFNEVDCGPKCVQVQLAVVSSVLCPQPHTFTRRDCSYDSDLQPLWREANHLSYLWSVFQAGQSPTVSDSKQSFSSWSQYRLTLP